MGQIENRYEADAFLNKAPMPIGQNARTGMP